jgi:predicted ATP-dependent endonuclease of OLD family
MKILYINNYRGFQKTYVPLTDVTFLLGENSTGKTSLLSLIHILSQSNFWLKPIFTTEEVSLDYFDEIVNRSIADSFEIGIFEAPSGIWMKFIERDGIPFLSEMRWVHLKQDAFIRRDESNIQYKISKPERYTKNDLPISYFKNWIHSNHHLTDLSVVKLDKAYNSVLIPNAELHHKFGKAIWDLPRFPRTTWIAPIRAKPKRYYEGYKVNFSSEGEHIPYLLKSIFQNGAHQNLRNELENFGMGSGLFEKIVIKTMSDDKNALFEIQIMLNGKPLKITNVGYGLSQVLPILVEILAQNATFFAIQQPEVHLHPKAQAMLGELFFHIAHEEQKMFIVETVSYTHLTLPTT